jgi:hypothetical protein
MRALCAIGRIRARLDPHGRAGKAHASEKKSHIAAPTANAVPTIHAIARPEPRPIDDDFGFVARNIACLARGSFMKESLPSRIDPAEPRLL